MSDGTDIWTLLAKLDDCCAVNVQTVYVTEPSGQTHREWEVRIARKGSTPDEEPVRVTHLSLLQAVLRALDEAKARGWPGPASTG